MVVCAPSLADLNISHPMRNFIIFVHKKTNYYNLVSSTTYIAIVIQWVIFNGNLFSDIIKLEERIKRKYLKIMIFPNIFYVQRQPMTLHTKT